MVGYFKPNKNKIPEKPEIRAISFEDLKAQLGGGPLCDITLTPKAVELGPIISFQKSNFGNEVDIIIPGILEITRGDNQGIFNLAVEPNYDNNFRTSPADTEWASAYTDGNFDENDYAAYSGYNYETWYGSRDFNLEAGPTWGQSLVGQWFVMHHIPSNRYWKITFTQWTAQNQGGGFAYTRQELLVVPEPCKITFSDGTKINSMSGLVEGSGVTEVIDINGFVKYVIGGSDILYSDILFVDPEEGNDATAQIGVFSKPYQSASTAISTAFVSGASTSNPSLVYLRKGFYSSITMQPNVHVYCEPGVVITGTLSGNAITSGQYSKFYGFAKFERFFGWSILMDQSSASGGRLDIEFDSIDAAGFISVNFAPIVKIKCNWARISGYNGGAYGVRMGDSADVTFDIREYYHAQHSLFILRRGSANIPFNGRLLVNCPDLKLIAPYTVNYGNANTAIVQSDGAGPGKVIINGECRTDRPGHNPSFMFQNAFSGPTVVEINGNVYGNNNHCIWTGYIGWHVDLRINGDLISNISPINCYLNNTNSDPGPSYITVRDSKIIGYANILGVSRYIKFMNCSFYQSADGIAFPTAPNITWQNDQLGQVKRADFYNCIAEANGASAEFMEFAGTGLTEITLVGCYGNKPVGTGLVPTFSDYVQVPSLKVLNRV